MKTVVECQAADAVMPDLLFDPLAVPEAVRVHVASCARCQGELSGLSRTMDVLEDWGAPEPSPFWDARMNARLREEMAQPARGWAGLRERFRTRLWLSNHALRPATAGLAALGLLIAAGGGAWLDLTLGQNNPPAVQASNTVRDLQSLNENAQVFQQMSALDSPDSSDGGAD